MPLSGGQRDRLILNSLFDLVEECLTTLGWLDAGRQHLPINLVGQAVDDHDVVPLNTLAVSAENVDSDYTELGSLAEERRLPHFVDLYAENDALGQHLIGDIREWLKGKIPPRTGPVLDVVDVTLATPVVAFSCVMENIMTERAHGFTTEHQKHWYECSVDVLDEN